MMDLQSLPVLPSDQWATEVPTFKEHPDGSITVDHFTPRINISASFLEDADERIEVNGETVTIRAANATAIYRFIGRQGRPFSARHEVYIAEKIS